MKIYFILILNVIAIALTLLALKNYYFFPALSGWFYFYEQWFYDFLLLFLAIWKFFDFKKIIGNSFPWILSLWVPILLWIPGGNYYCFETNQQVANWGVGISISCMLYYVIETFIILRIIKQKKSADQHIS